MIFGRCAFIIIYLVLSALNPSSATATSNIADLAGTRKRIVPDSRIVSRQQTILSPIARLQNESSLSFLKRSPNSSNLVEKPNSAANLATVGDATNSESVEASDLYWAFGAMTIALGISLFLMWLLFKEPSLGKRETDTAVTDLDSKSATEVGGEDNPVIEQATASAGIGLESDSSAATQQLQSVAEMDAIQKLIQHLQLEIDSALHLSNFDPAQITRQREAIWELTEIGDCRSIDPLLKMMPHAEEPDKSFIIAAVNQIVNRSFKPIDEQLFANLQDVNPEVRLNAIRDLRNLYQFVTPVITKIAQMQSDADYEVRQTAIQTLGQLNANPFPTFSRAAPKSTEQETDDLVSGEESEANLHLVAYLLAELDAEKQC